MRRIFLNYYLFIILILLLANFAVAPLVEKFAAAPFKKQFTNYYREVVKGQFFIILQDLQRYPQQNWQARLQQLQPEFGYPLSLVKIGAGGFSEPTAAQLREGQIVVGDGYDRFWRRVGRSDYALAMGPLPSPGIGRAVDVWTWGILLLLLGMAALLWALPFWRKLARISSTAAAFGEGNFDVRAQIPNQSALAPLADTFNQMADRIQQLITSHKELTNAVSHELRTPIARLRFGVEMMESSGQPAERARYGEGVHRDLDELEGLVSELLTYARFDRKTLDLHMVEQALVPWLKDVMEQMGNEVSAHLQQDLPADANLVKARFEPRHLRRALGNLIHNASRYGNGVVRLTLEQQAGGYLIHVDDDGPGIPEAERERVFEPFSRIDSSRSRESGGYGLGLAIVRRVMESHRGSVTIASSPLGGSRFTIRLPV